MLSRTPIDHADGVGPISQERCASIVSVLFRSRTFGELSRDHSRWIRRWHPEIEVIRLNTPQCRTVARVRGVLSRWKSTGIDAWEGGIDPHRRREAVSSLIRGPYSPRFARGGTNWNGCGDTAVPHILRMRTCHYCLITVPSRRRTSPHPPLRLFCPAVNGNFAAACSSISIPHPGFSFTQRYPSRNSGQP